MAQESIDDFIQMAKDYAKAEKDLEVQRWVFVSFERIDEQGNYVRLFSYDLPREIYDRKRWVMEWRKAKLVCKYPKGNVRYTLSFYDKRLGLDMRMNEDLKRLIAAKAQVTRTRRKIEEYVAYNRAYKKQVAYFVPSYRKEWIAEYPADEWIARNVNWATERQKELNAIAYLQPGE